MTESQRIFVKDMLNHPQGGDESDIRQALSLAFQNPSEFPEIMEKLAKMK